MVLYSALVWAMALIVAPHGHAHSRNLLGDPQSAALIDSVIGQWDFTPIYTLPGRAQNAPGLNHHLVESPAAPIAFTPQPFELYGKRITDSTLRLLNDNQLPKGPFSVEALLLCHVNQPVGALVGTPPSADTYPSGWQLTFDDRKVGFTITTRTQIADRPAPQTISLASERQPGVNNWLYHVVATFDGETVSLFLNGEKVEEIEGLEGAVLYDPNSTILATAHLENEPYMQLGDLLRNAVVFDGALEPGEIQNRFESQIERVLDGRFAWETLHFTAGPHLQDVTQDGIRIVWETDRPATAVLEYGFPLPMQHSIEINEPKRLHEVHLTNLEPNQEYFYNVNVIDEEGEAIESGTLTFRTAKGPEAIYSFAVIGDTEARPHIAARVSRQIWGERPDFAVVVGDLTDGGQTPDRFQWTHEYFASMTPLFSRIPSYPVVGNGESDLKWFKHYHALPGQEHYYKFQYGNAEFFMLDSNRDLSPQGEQYQWLEEQLQNSTATWKFACHHHPTFTSDEDDYGNTYEGDSAMGDSNVQNLVPLYEKYGVDVVFFGHLHTYERSWPLKEGEVNPEEGVIHVQTGGGGGNLEDAAPTRSWFMHSFYRGHHYCLVNIHQDTLQLKMVDVDGRLRDQIEVAK